eukprot:TRINITY_DN45709_c0_g1_i1.p1 TRINITY_DN45709_c0_g1~~TRINITY_DN45709_c0_g1_i1.p1  ORF type:complete len:652 (-),score=115.60 TRINITY_DN45709_c0_g1_i1:318-2273(-)
MGRTTLQTDPADIEAAIQAELPVDAPAGHKAHEKVYLESSSNRGQSIVRFNYKKERVSVSIKSAGSEANAFVIARACYVRCEQGDSKEKVLQFRQECFDRIHNAKFQVQDTHGPPPTAERQPDDTTDTPRQSEVPRLEADATESSVAPHGNELTDVVVASQSRIHFDKHHFCFGFTMKERGKQRKVTVKIKRASGKPEVAYRMAKLLREQIANGKSYTYALQLRDKMFERIEPGEEPSSDQKKAWEDVGKELCSRDKPPGREDEGTREEPPAKKARVEGEIPLPDDAPASHVAHKNVKSREKCSYFYFPHSDGTKSYMQATVQACNGSAELCAHVVRVLYMKFESGATRDEVEAYKKGLLASLRVRSSSSDAPAAAQCPENGTDALVKRLRDDGRLEGAIRLQGRAELAKNSSINGVYALLPDGFSGAVAYEKMYADAAAPRFLFFSSRKKRWKVNDSLADEKGGFAHARVDDDGQRAPSDPSSRLQWMVFEGKDSGYVEDPRVVCAPLVEAEAQDVLNSPAVAESDVVEVDDTGNVSDADGSEASAASDASSGSGSDANTSDEEPIGDDEGPAEVGMQTAPSETPGGAACEDASGAVAADVPSSHVAPVRPPQPPRGRVCAKMLARAHFRCSCHFATLARCPGRQSAKVG